MGYIHFIHACPKPVLSRADRAIGRGPGPGSIWRCDDCETVWLLDSLSDDLALWVMIGGPAKTAADAARLTGGRSGGQRDVDTVPATSERL
jgi:hypothetical protein